MKKLVGTFWSLLDRGVEHLVALLFLLMTIVGGMQVFNRFVLNSSLSWSEEFQKFSHIWIVYLTLAIGYERGSHISMRILVDRFPARLQIVMALGNDILWLFLAGALVYYTGVIMGVARFQTTPGLGVRMDFIYFGMVFGGCYLILCVLKKMPGHMKALFAPEPGGKQ